MNTKSELFKLLKIKIFQGNFDGLKKLIDENFKLKETLKSSRGKQCKDCPYQ